MCEGEVVCEPPNNKLDRFCGTLYWQDKKYTLTNQNMLLRGCVLRNTEACYGLVIFAGVCVIWVWKHECDVCKRFHLPCFFPGPDTKLMQNSGRTKFKRTSIDRLMNTLVLWVGHLKPLTFMAHTGTISGLDLSSLNLVSYISSNNVCYPYLGSSDQRCNCKISECTFRQLTCL